MSVEDYIFREKPFERAPTTSLVRSQTNALERVLSM